MVGWLPLLLMAMKKMKSWNGKITLKMFFVIQGQIHMFPWAWDLAKACTEDSCLNDLTAMLSLITEASKLSTPNGVLLPLHLVSLATYLKKVKRGSFLGPKLATFFRCNPAFTSHSQKSCTTWHIRRFELSKSYSTQLNFRSALEKDDEQGNKQHPLFAATFKKAQKNGSPYGDGPRELCRFVRDWHTHAH